jgi:hypothetical protein
MMDEAFLPLARMIEEMASFQGEFVDAEAGVRTYVRAFEIELPVEFDVTRDGAGGLRLGTTPPLYRVDTTFRPWYHHVRFTAELEEAADG